MKRISKTTLSLLITVVLVISSLCFTAAAEGAVILFSKSSVSVGDTLTVTVKFTSNEAMYGVECVINYNSDVLEYKSGTASGSAGVLKLDESPSGEKTASYALTFTAKAAGSSTVALDDCQIAFLGSNGAGEKGISGASATVTVKDAALSSNAKLKALSVSVGKLSPSFSASKTSYKVSVGSDVTECTVYATAADSGAKVEVSGNKTLNMGDNVRTVTVTAPSGAQKVYTVTINRGESTSSETEITDNEQQAAPLDTTVDGAKFEIAEDISDVKLLNGFTVDSTVYNGKTVQVAKSAAGDYTLYYLKSADGTEKVPYVLNEADNSFTKLSYFTRGDNSYILAQLPDGKTLPDGYYATSIEIDGINAGCYALNEIGMSDFYYLYCHNGTDFGFYRYDTKENTVQRYPELTAVDSVAVSDELPTEDGIIARFKTLSANAKIIVLGLCLVAVGIIALIVLFILRLVQKNRLPKYAYDADGADGFDEIVEESFSLLTETAPGDEDIPSRESATLNVPYPVGKPVPTSDEAEKEVEDGEGDKENGEAEN